MSKETRKRKREEKARNTLIWTLPLRPPVRVGYGPLYIQPVPVSGFPCALDALHDFWPGHYGKHTVGRWFTGEQLYNVNYASSRFLHPSSAHGLKQQAIRKWFDKNHNAISIHAPPGSAERGRLEQLLVRDPFMQEQPWLGALMVHPIANKKRYQEVFVPFMHQTLGHKLYPDVMNIVLALAYSDALHV